MQNSSRPVFLRHVSLFLALGLLASSTATTRGDFVPIALTADTFNQDMIVERTGPAPLLPATTASLEAGLGNTGASFFERGYVTDYPAAGLPRAGTIITSQLRGDYAYQFAPDYRSNNAALVDGVTTTARLTLSTPAAYAGLSFLTCSSAAGGSLRYTLHHQDGSLQTGTFACPNWFNTAGAVYTVAGRVDVVAFTLDNLSTAYPNLFAADITVSNAVSPLAAVDLAYASGSGHHAIFALSGIATPGDGATPIAVNGFNIDLVVESTAARSGYLIGITTAAMEDGLANKGFTWYEQGYHRGSTGTGLPAPGATITSALASDHRYTFAASYSGNDVVLIDDNTVGSLIPAVPSAFAALSFLGAAAHGPTTNACVISHADGTVETNWLLLPDWMGSAPAAFNANGRVRISTKGLDAVNSTFPRLFTADLSLVDKTSPVTNVVMTLFGGNPAARTVIFALSGSTSTTNQLSRPTLTITRGTDGALTIGSSAAGRLQSTAFRGAATVWQEEGPIVSTVTVSPGAGSGRFYRVAVP